MHILDAADTIFNKSIDFENDNIRNIDEEYYFTNSDSACECFATCNENRVQLEENHPLILTVLQLIEL